MHFLQQQLAVFTAAMLVVTTIKDISFREILLFIFFAVYLLVINKTSDLI